MNLIRGAFLLFITAACLLAQGCSYLMSEEEKQARTEMEAAAKAALAEDWNLAIQHADKSIALHPLPVAYLVRATARMGTQRNVDPAQRNFDPAIADARSGLKLDPDNSDLIRLENQLSSMKRLLDLAKSTPGLR